MASACRQNGKWRQLGGLCSRIYGGGTPSRGNPAYWGGNIPWASIKDLNSFRLSLTQENITEAGLHSSSAKMVSQGSIVVATRVGLGKVCIVERPIAINQDIKALELVGRVLPEYVAYYLVSQAGAIQSIGVGATVKGIRLDQLRALPVPLPFAENPSRSLDEQRRIVTRLEALLAEVNAARELQQRISEDANKVMDAILGDIFGGKVADWQTEKLGCLCTTTSGGTPSRKQAAYYGGTIPWVKSGELNDGLVETTEETITEAAIRETSAKVLPAGTLLMAMYGATVGKLGILREASATNQAICAIFPTQRLDRGYLFWYLRSLRRQLVSASFGGAQPNISQRVIRSIDVPLPTAKNSEKSLVQQRAIASRCQIIAEQVTVINGLSVESKDQLQMLEQSFLSQAFRGEL